MQEEEEVQEEKESSSLRLLSHCRAEAPTIQDYIRHLSSLGIPEYHDIYSCFTRHVSTSLGLAMMKGINMCMESILWIQPRTCNRIVQKRPHFSWSEP